MISELTADQARALLAYDPSSGELRWKAKRCNAVPAGSLTGYVGNNGYSVVRCGPRLYKAHRLAWLIHYGYWPHEVDHIDGNRSNNAISNLRECTRAQNAANRRRRSDNASGIKGVSWRAKEKKWCVQVRKEGRVVYWRTFACKDEAALAYQEHAAIHLGDFARVG